MVSNVMLTLCFLGAVLVIYYALPKAYRWICLLAASCVFYASVDPWMLLLIGGSTLWAWFAGLQIEGGKEENTISKKARGWLLGGSLPLIGVLFVFKYLNFFIESAMALFGFLGFSGEPLTLKLVMPLGISYYTFKLLSYLFDVYRGKMQTEKHFGFFALYVSFFPQILSGPIERAEVLLPQFREPAFDKQLFARGIQRIVLGLFKKMVIANRLSNYVNLIFADPADYPTLAAWMAAFFYAIQLYCDFSGYSDLALGMSDCMGIRCRENFRMPYFSTSIKEFWSRWHISLSSWLRDYVYIPLGGNRVSKARKNLNLLLTFLVSGLWHGDSWTFVVWGAMHGVWNMFSKKAEPKNLLHRIWKTLVTFAGMTFTLIFFRADTLATGVGFLKRMVTGFSLSYTEIVAAVLPFSGDNTCAALLLTVCLCIFLLFLYELQAVRKDLAEPAILSAPWLAVFLVLTLLLGVFGNSSFLYANF